MTSSKSNNEERKLNKLSIRSVLEKCTLGPTSHKNKRISIKAKNKAKNDLCL